MIIGNILSFFAALFMVASCVVKRKQAVFFCQFLECALLAVASVFFGSLAGMTTLVLSAVRNLVVAKGRYTKPVMVAFVILTIVAGLLANTRGLVGLLPVLATVEYTICCHYIEGEMATKCSIFVNVLVCICPSVPDLRLHRFSGGYGGHRPAVAKRTFGMQARRRCGRTYVKNRPHASKNCFGVWGRFRMKLCFLFTCIV